MPTAQSSSRRSAGAWRSGSLGGRRDLFVIRRATVAVATLAALVLLGLASVSRAVHVQNEQRLLERQVDQAGAQLSLSISQIEGPLTAAARAASASQGDLSVFTELTSPLVGENGLYADVTLFRAGDDRPVIFVGAPDSLVDAGVDPVDFFAPERRADFVILDLLALDRRLGYVATDGKSPPEHVVYAERVLNIDPTATRRRDEPFADLDYAIYLDDIEDDDHLLGASTMTLPIEGRRSSVVIDFGDRELLLVATPLENLGSSLLADLWWIILLSGGLAIASTMVLLRRLERSRRDAVVLAEENEQIYHQQLAIAETLQLNLLPRRLDVPPGAQVAARYWPAGSAAMVGGDFYDAFAIDDDRWGVLIGDVCGKGIEAAALTGLVRHTVRAAARTTRSPADVLGLVYRAITDHASGTFCTVCFIVVEPRGAGGRLTVALGGHDRPLLHRFEGEVLAIGEPGSIIGMIEPSVTDAVIDVGPGDTLLLYTDGLTDAPGTQAVGIGEITDLLATGESLSVDEIADEIRFLKRARRPDGSGDDTAVLVMRFGGRPVDLRGGTTDARSADSRSGDPVGLDAGR